MHDLKLARLALHFSSDVKARELLERVRWPDGPTCPHCDTVGAYRLEPKATSTRPVRPGVLKCRSCKRQFTVTVGTVFHGSHVPLHKWLLAVALLCASKKGHSAHQLHRMLGVSYRTAWFMMHRLRHAMAQPEFAEKLAGVVEADETYIGGYAPGPRGRGARNKTPVFSLVQRGGDVRSFIVDRVTAANLKGIIREHVERDAHIMTDEFSSYRGLAREFASHDVVKHRAREYVRGAVYTNTVEGFFGLLKRGILGTYHHVSRRHLHRYLAEFDFRYNNRRVSDEERTARAIRATVGKRLHYRKSSRSTSVNALGGE